MIKGPTGPKGPNWQGLRNKNNDPVDLDETFPPHHYNLMGGSEYQSLPEAIKAHVTPKDYLWLDDEGKRNLIADFTLPEVQED